MALTFVQRIKELLTGKRDIKSGVRLVINCEKLENRVALLDKGVVEEYNIERVGTNSLIGSVFKGRIRNIEQGLKAMFIDIGFDKNAFLHFWDAIPAALDAGLEEINRGGSKKKKRIEAKDIPSLYPVGSEIMVQVTKGPVGNKGPRVTTNISLAGRLLVLMPLNDTCGISRKIEDPKERSRLRKIIEKISLPEGMGIILRTEASGKRARHIVRDLNILLDEWDQIVAKRDGQNAPVCCFQEPDLVERTVRDFLTEDIDEVACDDGATVERMQRMAALISGRAKRRINYYQGQTAIFEHYGIQKQIDNAFYRQVWLPCGGYIVIDQTEALVSIDVNTGRNKGHKDVDKLLLETNLEAAAEVARQLRLRNMGGLIVVDFIDMKHRRDQQAVYKLMMEHLKRDKAKTQVLPISQFGLMEMTRQRLNESLGTTLYEPCPYCKGHGQVKTPLTMSVELQRRLVSVLGRAKEDQKSLIVIVHPEVLNRLKTEDGELLVDLERKYQARLTFRSDPAFHREQITLANATTGEEIRV
ncbi:Rne/Rng family ribonuclease [Prosthecobacter vanneervenii]|uniref:Ribonuclease G n=1 Tax=Prosthecobacter vanneervenii TaxID=48466 RepID=A0A7W8DM28_9BACT|nr:Rne/Rng family ribonuclease [Prosthecobacter vanneervenii]MBB5034787.1 ribonuclease G [Prosthecobacter vanneervenii]